jgi:hypothetical protein
MLNIVLNKIISIVCAPFVNVIKRYCTTYVFCYALGIVPSYYIFYGLSLVLHDKIIQKYSYSFAFLRYLLVPLFVVYNFTNTICGYIIDINYKQIVKWIKL